ncbi:MAG: DNA-directed RNA polymerase subunit omega [Desulfobulbaceae bacterium]|uniref:DNA-directed RNA polymerase subunit omega n=1 Tax=Candidatus Desulfobia pelagia TaxID=2841692 RepID=A0A8J6TG58_9BACT|nr:DNA-directed RNA polymerase subunit omega [Candidatus Desulfobia pelagia]
MARITVQDCLKKIGNENRFKLIHLAVARVKQHRKGQPYLTKGKNKEIVMSLREIAAGVVTFDNLNELDKPSPAIETPAETQDTTVAQS